MTPKAMAAIHGRSFVTPRAWTEAEFEAQLADPLVVVIGDGKSRDGDADSEWEKDFEVL